MLNIPTAAQADPPGWRARLTDFFRWLSGRDKPDEDSPTPFQVAGLILGLVVWFVSWLFIYWHFQAASATPEKPVNVIDVPYWLTVGLSVGAITVLTFYGFYVTKSRTPDESMRSAIAAALVVFYIVLVTDLLVVPGLMEGLGTGTPAAGDQEATESFGQGLFTGLSGFVGVILAFYFAATAVTDKAKTDAKARTDVAETDAKARKEAAETEARGMTEAATLTANAASPRQPL